MKSMNMVCAWGELTKSGDTAFATKLVISALLLLAMQGDANVDAQDASPGNPKTKSNQAVRLMKEGVLDAPGQSLVAPIVLGLQNTRFTLDGQPAFLFGISYYGALGAPEEFIRLDLADMKRHGFNWIRVWATWSAFANDVSAVDAEGQPREPFLSNLKWLVGECGQQGFVVDVTLSRGNGVTGPPRLKTSASHARAVQTLVQALTPYRNWYLDLSNERNIRDQRHTSFEELKSLRQLVRGLDPQRLVTASYAGDLNREELKTYLLDVRVDFITPHRPRQAKSPGQTQEKTQTYLAWMQELGRVIPIHYQEPFRRGFGAWEPGPDDFVNDLRGALAGGAAGWCFHNGDQRHRPEGQPRRSFDLRAKRLFEQLDKVEQDAVSRLREVRQKTGG
jgi:hypothetical protein